MILVCAGLNLAFKTAKGRLTTRTASAVPPCQKAWTQVASVDGRGPDRRFLGELAAHLRMPVAVAELGAVPAGSVDGAAAAALGVDVRDGTPRAAVSEYLGAGSQLLVIDNCEHVLADARELTGALLRACPQVRIIATSRHRLGLRDEQVLPLDPLLTEAEDVPAELLRDTAPVRLFIDRIRRVRPTLPVTAKTVALSAALCRRLDGVPLAIELAAAQAATIGLAPTHPAKPQVTVPATSYGAVQPGCVGGGQVAKDEQAFGCQHGHPRAGDGAGHDGRGRGEPGSSPMPGWPGQRRAGHAVSLQNRTDRRHQPGACRQAVGQNEPGDPAGPCDCRRRHRLSPLHRAEQVGEQDHHEHVQQVQVHVT